MEAITTKVCTKCAVEKPRNEFYSRGDGTMRVQAKCKSCLQKENRAGKQREYRKTNPELFRGYELKKHYGITLEDYTAVLEEQGGVCAICRVPPGAVGTGNKSKGNLAVDHCHVTGSFRGLLCTNCNLGLGSFFENPELLRNAAAYLEDHRALLTKLIGRRVAIAATQKDLAEGLLDELLASSSSSETSK